jgi:hypothetical protein
MKFTVQVLWPTKAPTTHPTPDEYEPNAIAVTLAVPVEVDQSCGALRNKILRRFSTQTQLQQLQLSDLADKDGALLDLEDTIAELYPENATSPSDRIVQVKTSWAEPASRKRPREEECARDVELGPYKPSSQRKRQRRSSNEGERGGRAKHSKNTQPRLAEVVIEDSQPPSIGQVSSSISLSRYHTPSQITPAPGGPASSNPAPTSGQRPRNSQIEQSQSHANASALFIPDGDDEASGMLDLEDEVLRLSDEEGTTQPRTITREGSVASSQWRHLMSSGQVCRSTNIHLRLIY